MALGGWRDRRTQRSTELAHLVRGPGVPRESQFESWGQILPGLVAMSWEVNFKERCLLKSTLPPLLYGPKDKIHKRESGSWGLISGSVAVTRGGLSRALAREESTRREGGIVSLTHPSNPNRHIPAEGPCDPWASPQTLLPRTHGRGGHSGRC